MFISDNSSTVHKKVLKKITEVNQGVAFPYGNDPYTKHATEMMQSLFNKDTDVYFTINGTSANVIGLSALMQSYESVICAESTHINTDECGALEKYIGAKISSVEHNHGKINVQSIEKFLLDKGNEHHNQPKIISISQCTEFGSVYTPEEIKEIADFTHRHDMYLHMDGARIANAAVSLGISFNEMIADTGVDLLSFGGTKNGMMMGEAIISFRPEVTSNPKFIRKQGMQLVSKMRYISAQFIAYLEDDLWRDNATQANSTAQYLAKRLTEIPEIEIKNAVNANMIFARFPQEIIDKTINKEYYYLMYPLENVVRMVTSYNSTKEDVDQFIDELQK